MILDLKNKQKPRYFSAEDYLNLFNISLVSIFILQATFRLLTYNDFILDILNGFCVLLLCLGLASAVRGFVILSTKGRNMTAELAVQILERYIREHKNGKKEEERDVSSALAYLLENGLVDKNIMNLNINEERPKEENVITDKTEEEN